MTPAEFRTARKSLKLTQAEMAERIGRSRSQVIRYEQGDDIPPIVQKLIRMMLAAL